MTKASTSRLIVQALDAGDRLAELAERLNDGPDAPAVTAAIEDYRRFSRQLDVQRIETRRA